MPCIPHHTTSRTAATTMIRGLSLRVTQSRTTATRTAVFSRYQIDISYKRTVVSRATKYFQLLLLQKITKKFTARLTRTIFLLYVCGISICYFQGRLCLYTLRVQSHITQNRKLMQTDGGPVPRLSM
jgi:hypothetical protein